jgi:hypothetical protein
MSEEEEETPQGSWTPMIIVLLLVLIRWIVFGQGSIVPVRVRRWYNMKVRRCMQRGKQVNLLVRWRM